MTELLPASVEADAVAVLLRDLRVSSAIYCRSEMTAPWGFGVQPSEMASFHVVTLGESWLDVPGEPEPRHLRAGDLVLLPRGDEHWMRDAPGSAVLWLDELLAAHPADGELRLRAGGGGARTDLLCGGFAIEGRRPHPLLSALPAVVHLPGKDGRPLPWLAATIELIAIEAGRAGRGAAAVCERLAEVMLAQALRAALADLELLRDAAIARAARAIHERPEHPWTLAELADLAAMSRSAFASRFRALTGDSPIRYATRWRLARAARRLRSSDATLAEIAALAGYESEFSFSRAFKRAFGVAPGTYRRAAD